MSASLERDRADWLIAVSWEMHLRKEQEGHNEDLVLDASAVVAELFPGLSQPLIDHVMERLKKEGCFREVFHKGDRWQVVLSDIGLENGERQYGKHGRRERLTQQAPPIGISR